MSLEISTLRSNSNDPLPGVPLGNSSRKSSEESIVEEIALEALEKSAADEVRPESIVGRVDTATKDSLTYTVSEPFAALIDPTKAKEEEDNVSEKPIAVEDLEVKEEEGKDPVKGELVKPAGCCSIS